MSLIPLGCLYLAQLAQAQPEINDHSVSDTILARKTPKQQMKRVVWKSYTPRVVTTF